MNPTDIETMFEINPNDMPKMSSVEGGSPTLTTIYKFRKAFNSQALSILSTINPDLEFLGEVIPATQYTERNNNIAYVVPQIQVLLRHSIPMQHNSKSMKQLDYTALWRKPENEQVFDNFEQFFTAADDDRCKNSETTGSFGYSANTIEQLVQKSNEQHHSPMDTTRRTSNSTTTSTIHK